MVRKFLGESSRNSKIVEFPKSEPFKRTFWEEGQMERKFSVRNFLKSRIANTMGQTLLTVAPRVAASLHLRWMVDLTAAMSLSLYCNDPLERTTWGNKSNYMRFAAELSKTKICWALGFSLTSEMRLISLKARLVPFESFLLSREYTISSIGLHCSDTQCQCFIWWCKRWVLQACVFEWHWSWPHFCNCRNQISLLLVPT